MYHCRDADISPATGYVLPCLKFTACEGHPNAAHTRRCQMRFCHYDARAWLCCACRLPNRATPLVCLNADAERKLCEHKRCGGCESDYGEFGLGMGGFLDADGLGG